MSNNNQPAKIEVPVGLVLDQTKVQRNAYADELALVAARLMVVEQEKMALEKELADLRTKDARSETA